MNYPMIFLKNIKNLYYIHAHPEITKIIISDAADVIFHKNVFDDITEDHLHACYDRNCTFHHYYFQNRINKTYVDKHALQAGLFGGMRTNP